MRYLDLLMTRLSYAQNLEDVMLWRCFEDDYFGFYIDVGAGDPEYHSVTKSFYDAGWCGVNIEPNREFFAKLVKSRTKDINLNVGVTDHQGISKFYEIPGTGLSTLFSEYVSYSESFAKDVRESEIEVTTLSVVCQKYVRSEIDFIKIDVEGSEKAVLAGADFNVFRPKIVLLEAMVPHVQIESHSSWEHYLFRRGYFFSYADGLNRFYLAEEHSHLSKHFRYPPNVFDMYTKINDISAVPLEIHEDVQSRLDSILNSNSWKLTSSFMKIFHFLKKITLIEYVWKNKNHKTVS